MGVPYVPFVGLVGSDLLKRRDDMMICPDPFDPSIESVVVRALRPDVALLHGLRADKAGNVDLGAVTDDVLLAEAAHRVVVTVEEVVNELTEAEAQGTFLPKVLVHVLAHAPYGAHPGGMPGRYAVDAEHMRRYVAHSQDDDAFAAYLQETVYGVADHQAYLEKVVCRDRPESDPDATPAAQQQRQSTS